jgi:hypothetical protein
MSREFNAVRDEGEHYPKKYDSQIRWIFIKKLPADDTNMD